MRKGSVLVGIIILLTGLMTVGVALASSVLSSSIKVQKQYKKLEALSYAEAGLNKGLWKVNQTTDVAWLTQAKTSQGILQSDLPGGEYRVKIKDCNPISALCNYIESVGHLPNEAHSTSTRTVRVKINGVQNNSAISFKYGVQVDKFGAILENRAMIKGSFFTNGPIATSNNSTITGSATSHGHNFLESSIGLFGGGATINGDAKAFTITGVTVKGTKTTGVYPLDQEMPIADADLIPTMTGWETTAQNGSVHPGNLTTSGSGNKLGPIKIDGDWIVNNNAEVEVTGTIWVTGNITINNNAKLFLTSSYGTNSGVIIADHSTDRNNQSFGKITIRQGATVSGIDKNNPKTPSYIMMFATNKPSGSLDWVWTWFVHAITIQQGSVGGVYYAPYGSLDLENNAQARALACAGLIIRQNAIVDYDSGMANSNFANGPAGKWTITEWLILN